MAPKILSVRLLFLLAGPITGAVAFFWMRAGSADIPIAGMLATTLCMAIWWVTAAMPLAATALLPIIAYPAFAINTAKGAAQSYFNSTIMLFIGGFLIAIAMEKSELHRRISLNIIAAIGRKPIRVVMGFMIASAFLSMWISNTATALMMLSIGLGVVHQLEKSNGGKMPEGFELALMLAIAYGCSIGGVATLIGTPTNLVLVAQSKEFFPELPEITFGSWLMLGLPYSLGMAIIAWLLFSRVFFRKLRVSSIDVDEIGNQLHSLPKISSAETRVAIVFAATCFLWIFRKEIALGSFSIPGWSSLHEALGRFDDSTVAIFMAVILFITPTEGWNFKERLLDDSAWKKLPWSIIILFGGGFTLAAGFVSSGLSQWIAQNIVTLADLSPFLLIAVICLSISLLTEFTSNVATASVLLPVLASFAPTLGIHPFLLMVPATIAASMAFMMPVATPPNAIVFSSGRLTIKQMARVGIWLNLIAVVWATVLCQAFVLKIWGN